METTKSEERYVPAAKRNKWTLKRGHGDLQAIHDKTGIPKHRIRSAFSLGYCDSETEKAIDKYYGI